MSHDSSLCIAWSFDYNWALCTVPLLLLKTRFIIVASDTAEKCCTAWDGNMYPET
jgi:hypothetical protein